MDVETLLKLYELGERSFTKADLHQARLAFTLLSGANLSHADLYKANLKGAILR